MTVEDKDSQFLGWLKNTKIFTAVAEGDMTCKYTDDGHTSWCGFWFNDPVYNAGLVPVVWAGETFLQIHPGHHATHVTSWNSRWESSRHCSGS